MKSYIKEIVLAVGVFLFLSQKALSLSPVANCEAEDYQYSIGTDVSPWMMEGYSFLYSSLSGNCRLTLETWEIVFPQGFIDLNKHNKAEDWRRKATGVSLYLDTFYTAQDEKWYSGLIFSTFRSSLSRIDHTKEKSYRSYEILLRFGYKYHITKQLSIDPWFALGPIVTDGKEPKIFGETFQESKFQVLATMHVSYKLSY